MAVLPIYNCFHPVLKKTSEPVKEFDQELKDLVNNLFDTMYAAENGIGLAAPQIGVLKRVLVIDPLDGYGVVKNNPVTLINPEILEFSDNDWEYQEGCLSVPTLFEAVLRPKEIKVKYYDIDMKEHISDADEILSRVIQHEIDHLNGELFFEKISPLRRAMIKSKLKKIQKGKVEVPYPMILPDGTLQK